jgi:hypothetical protein
MSLTPGSPPTTEQLLFKVIFKNQVISYMWFRSEGSEHQVIEFNEPIFMEVGEMMAISIHQLDAGFPPYSLSRALFGYLAIEVNPQQTA